jgi:hypothetical protein
VRLKRLESVMGAGPEAWQETLQAVVEGREPAAGSAPIPIWALDKIVERFEPLLTKAKRPMTVKSKSPIVSVGVPPPSAK